MNLVFDTSVWIDHLRHNALQPMWPRIHDGFVLWFTSVAAAELWAGCRSKGERRTVDRLLLPFRERMLTPAHADFMRAAKALSRLRESAQTLKNPGGALLDGLQAVLAAKIGALVVSQNVADFRMLQRHIPVRADSLEEFARRF